MNVLVTGGAGYIGSHTCKALALAGHIPVAYDNLSMGHRWAVQWGPLVVGELANQFAVEQAIAAHDIEAVVHFAARAYVGESMQDPMLYFVNNSLATTCLLQAMMKCNVRKIVFSSTCATYGIPEHLPIDEGFQTRPVNPYGESKLAVENMLRWLGKLKGLNWVGLRYFNAAGADPDAEIGELHDPETHLIPLALRAACPGDFRLQLFGTDYPTPDGTAIRDYVHVNDLASAHVLALEKLNTQMVNDVFNLGTGKGISVLQLLSTVSATVGSDVRYVASPRREGDPPVLVARADKAQRHLEWVPRHSAIENIVRDAWNWEQKNRIQRRPL
jgi:UDP-arabinose 4-epimerase